MRAAIPAPNSEKAALAPSVPVKAVPTKHDLSDSFSKLDVKGQPDPVSSIVDHGPLEALRQSAKLDDEKTHLSISSTKAPSLDGKSVASITTFAMDEKESIRPDDSASVQAAEDEDSNSGPGSGAQNSGFGSDAGAKAFHSQLREISQQQGIPLPRKLIGAMIPEAHANDIQQPLSINDEQPKVGPQGVQIIPQYPFCMPDEKLLEALDSAKDRLFLLQLEQQFISFIQDSQANSLDLGPYNSFFRLLAHRLGDYYKLSHWADSSTNAVRLYKTNETLFAQLPMSLSAFRRKLSEEGPSAPPSMQIMRRSGVASVEMPATESGDNTNANSVAASKATSEAGDEVQKASAVGSPEGSTTARDKATKTREEREAKYKEARDRIFGDWKEGENGDGNPSTEVSAQASRASSVNGRRKKRNQKNDDDGFQARSAFNIVYPNRPPNFDTSGGTMGFYNPFMQQNGPQAFQAPYGQNYGPQYQPMQQSQFFAGQMAQQGAMTPNTMMMNVNGAQQLFMGYHLPQQPMMDQFYPQMQQPQNQMSFQPSVMQSPNAFGPQSPRPGSQMSDQNWVQAGMQNPYQVFGSPTNAYQPQAPQPVQQTPVSNTNNLSVPYAYGQLPYQSPSPSNRDAHPVPGSYNRQTFNAQSRVFVPGESGFISSSAGQSSPQSNSMGQAPVTPQAGTGFGYPTPRGPHSQLLTPSGHSNSSSPRKSSSRNSQNQSPGASTISKWGTPSTLPPKPPPPASQHNVSNSMPTFQNGTYSKPTGAPQDAKVQ